MEEKIIVRLLRNADYIFNYAKIRKIVQWYVIIFYWLILHCRDVFNQFNLVRNKNENRDISCMSAHVIFKKGYQVVHPPPFRGRYT